MFAMRQNISIRILINHLFCFLLLFAATLPVEAASAVRRVVVLDVRIENDIGVENAGPVATRWLIDSIVLAEPGARALAAEQASELARLKLPSRAEDLLPSAAVTLMKSIDSTHVLGGKIFLWKQKYGVTLRLIELPDVDRARVERAWANSAADIPAVIEELAAKLFSPPTEVENTRDPASNVDKKKGDAERNGVPAKVEALLEEHPEMVYVPGGKFLMGNDNDSDADNIPVDPSRREGVSRLVLLATEKPEQTVTLGPFLIDRHEVTNAQYKKFRPSHVFPAEKGDHPVTGISWHDAQAYAAWAGKRLPTEEEWEKAARGTDGRKWPWGNVFERGRCNLGAGITPVGSFEGDRSPYGALDMAGNVQEWTASPFTAYRGNFSKNIAFDPKKKVVRGSYYGGNDFLARCSMRFCALPGARDVKPEGQNYGYIGFRCAMDIQ